MQDVEFLGGEVHARDGVAAAELKLRIGVGREEAEGYGLGDKGAEAAVVGLYGVVGKRSAGVYTLVCFEPVIEEVDGGEGDVVERLDTAEEGEDVGEETVLSAGGGCAAFFLGSAADEIKEGCGGGGDVVGREHGEGKGCAVVEAGGVCLVDVSAEGIDAVVEGVGIGAGNDTPVFKLPLADLDACADKLALLGVADFELDECGTGGGGLAFAVEKDTDLEGIHERYLFWYLFLV